MHLILRTMVGLGAASLLGAVTPVFAEAAPVFDADSMQQSFDGDAGQGPQDLAPPASSNEQAFVPIQSQASNNVSVSSSSSPSSSSVTSGMSLDQRMRRAEQQIGNMQNNENAAKVDSLQDQVQTLRGQVEQLTHQLEEMQAQQKLAKKAGANDSSLIASDDSGADQVATTTTSKSKSKLMSAKQSAKTIVNAPAAATTDSQPNVAEEQEIYQTAYNLIKAKKYNEAVDALQGMLKKYPSGQFASNAHYWLGELYGLMGKNDLALNEFTTVVGNYPESPRVSDAQLKVGLIYSAQSKWVDAKSSFKKVVSRYPGTASARVASEQLKQIKTAGH